MNDEVEGIWEEAVAVWSGCHSGIWLEALRKSTKKLIQVFRCSGRYSKQAIHDPSVRAGEDISCLRPRGHCDWQLLSDVVDSWMHSCYRDFVLKLSELQLLLHSERDYFAIDLRHTVHQVSAPETPGSHSDQKLVNRNCFRLLQVYIRRFI
jgi:hypothetical protein